MNRGLKGISWIPSSRGNGWTSVFPWEEEEKDEIEFDGLCCSASYRMRDAR